MCVGVGPPPPPRHGRWGSPSPNPPPGTATKEGEGGVGQMGLRAIPPPQSNFLPAFRVRFVAHSSGLVCGAFTAWGPTCGSLLAPAAILSTSRGSVTPTGAQWRPRHLPLGLASAPPFLPPLSDPPVRRASVQRCCATRSPITPDPRGRGPSATACVGSLESIRNAIMGAPPLTAAETLMACNGRTDLHTQSPVLLGKHKLLGDLKIALRGGGGGDMDARRRRGGGVGEMAFRVGPFVLCKNGCWRRRRRNTNFGPKKFFPPIISPPHI